MQITRTDSSFSFQFLDDSQPRPLPFAPAVLRTAQTQLPVKAQKGSSSEKRHAQIKTGQGEKGGDRRHGLTCRRAGEASFISTEQRMTNNKHQIPKRARHCRQSQVFLGIVWTASAQQLSQRT